MEQSHIIFMFQFASAFDQDISEWSEHVCGREFNEVLFSNGSNGSWTAGEKPNFGACNN
ncbi:MAG: hypothetical protein ACI9IL_000409 [Rickettsiales bacterium]|jgi:hypothetical protein